MRMCEDAIISRCSPPPRGWPDTTLRGRSRMAVGINHGEQVLSESSKSTKKFSVDMTKPMVAQVGHLGEDYDEWVHDHPVTRKETPRMFESDVLELVTKAKWWMIPMIWGPVVVWCQTKAVADGLPMNQLLPNLILGLLIWTLLEYLTHRYVFHLKASGYWTNTFHYIIHGFHHKHPQDGDRLVFPPLYTLFIAVPLWQVLHYLVPSPNHPSVYGGILLGYIVYDVTHYALHFGTASIAYFNKLKKYHSNHHFKKGMHNYDLGTTSKIWDMVFGTLPPSKTHPVTSVPENNGSCNTTITNGEKRS